MLSKPVQKTKKALANLPFRAKLRPIFICLTILLSFLLSCDPSGNLFLTNGFDYDVEVCTIYNINNETIERVDIFYPGMTFAVAAMGNIEYNNIISIIIKNTDGLILAEYSLEYLTQLRKTYKNKNKRESWIFTEKGLFLKTINIERRFNFDSEKILEYYRSDEAVNERGN